MTENMALRATGGHCVLTISNRFVLSLLGSFRLADADGVLLPISSKKSIAMIAMLATSPNGERTRAWLQDRLWGSRGEAQARASMRRELANMHKALGTEWENFLQVDARRIRLRLENVNVDVVRVQPEGFAPAKPTGPDAEFLEGVDVRGEPAFVEWLKLVRSSIAFAGKAGPPKAESWRPTDSIVALRRADEGNASIGVWLPAVDDFVGPGETSSPARACANEIAGWLARIRWLKVLTGAIAIGDARHAPAEREPPFVVERAIQRMPSQESVELRLLRADTHELVWVESVAIQGERGASQPSVRLAAQLVARIEREVQAWAIHSSGADDFRALIWRARWHVNRLSRSDAAIAARLIDRALSLAPQSPEAIIQKAVGFAWEKWARRAPRQEFGALADMARDVMLLDPDDCRGYWLAGVAETWVGNSNTAVAWLRRAIEIDPTFEPAYAQLGGTLNLSDRPAEALEALAIGAGLSPNDTHLFFRHTEFALSTMLLGRFEDSVEWANRALLLRPGYWFAQTIKIHALVELGRRNEAQDVAGDLQVMSPGFSVDYLTWAPFVDRAWPERIIASVRSASAPVRRELGRREPPADRRRRHS